MPHVGRGIEQHTAALLHRAAQHHQILPLIAQHTGVAPVLDMKTGMDAVQQGVFVRLDKGGEVVIRCLGIPLLSAVGTVAVIFFPADAGIEEVGLALFILAAAAGEAMNFPLRHSRRKRGRQGFPMQQIAGTGMSPMNVPPLVAVGIVLVKHMIPALIVHKAVGIVDPVLLRAVMPDGLHLVFLLVKSAPAGNRRRACGLLIQSPEKKSGW